MSAPRLQLAALAAAVASRPLGFNVLADAAPDGRALDRVEADVGVGFLLPLSPAVCTDVRILVGRAAADALHDARDAIVTRGDCIGREGDGVVKVECVHFFSGPLSSRATCEKMPVIDLSTFLRHCRDDRALLEELRDHPDRRYFSWSHLDAEIVLVLQQDDLDMLARMATFRTHERPRTTLPIEAKWDRKRRPLR